MMIHKIWIGLRSLLVVAVGVVTTTGAVHAQVQIQIRSIATSSGVKQHHAESVSAAWDSIVTQVTTHNRTETLDVRVRNMLSAVGDYRVEWQFLAKDIKASQNYAYDHGSISVVGLVGGSFTNFEVQSKPLVESETNQFFTNYYDDGSVYDGHSKRILSGAKPVGYVFFVKQHGKLIAVEASDNDLKKPYQKEIDANTHHPPL